MQRLFLLVKLQSHVLTASNEFFRTNSSSDSFFGVFVLFFFFFSFWCVFLVYELKRKKKRKRQVIRKKWMGKSDMSLMTAHQMISVIKVRWKCHQRPAACQLLEHYGRVISWDISVRLSELYSKRYSECSLKREA